MQEKFPELQVEPNCCSKLHSRDFFSYPSQRSNEEEDGNLYYSTYMLYRHRKSNILWLYHGPPIHSDLLNPITPIGRGDVDGSIDRFVEDSGFHKLGHIETDGENDDRDKILQQSRSNGCWVGHGLVVV